MKNLIASVIVLFSHVALAQSGVYIVDPSARPAANITTTVVGADRGLDVNLIGGSVNVSIDAGISVSGTVTANQGVSRDGGVDWPVSAKLVAADGTTPLGTASAPLRVDPTGSTTQPVSGTVAVSGSVAVTQSTSPWVTSATQSGAWNVGQSGTWTVEQGTPPWTVTANAGTNLNTSALNLEATQSAMSAKLPATLGQKTMANSFAVAIASDQSAVPVSLSSTAITGTVAVTQSTSPWVTSATQSGTWNIGSVTALDVNLSTRLAEATFTGRWPAAGALSDDFANPTTTQVGSFGMVWDGSTWDRTPGNSIDGLTVNLGANNDVTVSGTVTANQGTPNSSANRWKAQITDGTDDALVSAGGALLVDGSATTQPVSGTVAATQSGTWNVTNVSGTVSLPTGASTAANQTTLGSQTTKINDGTDTVVVSGSGSLQVTCDNCGGSTFADNSAFTFGTSTVLNVGYVVDDTAPNSVTENSAGNPRMAANRVPYAQLRDAAGNERGANVTAGNALVVDGSAVTQPVSIAATVSANTAQIAGTTTAVNNGAVSNGVQRVTIANDSTGVLATVNNVATIGTSVTPGTGATNLGKAEDGTAASGDVGVATLLVRKDTNATMTSADSEYVHAAADNYGVQSMSLRHPNAINCTISSTATTSTVVTGCSAPGAGLSIYITSLQWASSIISTTANFMLIQSGTGGTCGTGTTAIYRGFQAPAFNGSHNVVFGTPIKVTANHEVCFVHAAAGTRFVNIQGFIAP